jgi:L-seryl-tRNA(Ser) seleniumtransferase
VHTNLGRAPLSAAAVDAIVAASGHTDVELDLATGARARRGRGALGALAAAVPAAAAVHVVNNGAAALALAAAALAAGREIVVSRGEMVEIGDGFRLPDLLESTGARLREVGTTNRTTVDDYATAISQETAFLLKVHPSNFVVRGFTSAVPVRALAALPAPVVVDIGSGLLAPDPLLPQEPSAAAVLRDGARLVTASGDKLLGGPQAGLLLGDAVLVERLRRHPLARAVRVDKLTLAALEATLRGPQTPVWQALSADPEQLRARVERLCGRLDGGRRRRGAVDSRRRWWRRTGGRTAVVGVVVAGGLRGTAAPRRPARRRPRRARPAAARPALRPGGAGQARSRRDPRRGGLTCSSSPRPATSTTASRRWCAR